MSEEPKVLIPMIKSVDKKGMQELMDYMGSEECTQDMISLIRKALPVAIARDIVDTQPMDGNIMKNLMDNALSEDELKAGGYEPVSSDTRPMWVKKETK